MALGFDAKMFQGLETAMSKIDVEYARQRPTIPWRGRIDAPPELNELLRRWFATKAEEWAYEQEVRYVWYLRACLADGGRYYKDFPVDSLKQIILGPRSQITASYLCDAVRQRYSRSDIAIKVARMCREEFQMRLENG